MHQVQESRREKLARARERQRRREEELLALEDLFSRHPELGYKEERRAAIREGSEKAASASAQTPKYGEEQMIWFFGTCVA